MRESLQAPLSDCSLCVLSPQLQLIGFLGRSPAGVLQKGQQSSLACGALHRTVRSADEHPHGSALPDSRGGCTHTGRGLLDVSRTHLMAIYQTRTWWTSASVTAGQLNAPLDFNISL